jgi:hypothetical protein
MNYLAAAALTSATGMSISAISSAVSLASTIKTLSVSDHVKEQVRDMDIEATVSTLTLVVKTHKDGGDDFRLARHYVIKALEKVKFDLETIHVKTKLHHEGWISRWRTLNLRTERKKLASSMKILKTRFRLMWALAKPTEITRTVYSPTTQYDYLIEENVH